MTSIPLVVDLDGTLVKTDLLFESANAFVTRNPFQIFSILVWAIFGKSTLKTNLAQNFNLDAAVLPYNHELIAWLKEQKRIGRKLILATASHKMLADKVAEHLELFDEVLATENGINLKGGVKCEHLVSKYGEKGFDYIGDSSADILVWKSARDAYLVSANRSLIRQVERSCNIAGVFGDKKQSIVRGLMKALRPHQWMKNLLVLAPLMGAHLYLDSAYVVLAILAFIYFSMTASGIYLLNDLVDVVDDRHHVSKRNRPFASGNLSLLYGWLMWPMLILSAFALSAVTMPQNFVGVLAAYFVITIVYSLKLKRKPILDVLTLAALYTLRIIAGAVAIGVPLSFWLLAFSTFIFLSLAFIKRFSELKSAKESRYEGKIRGRGYVKEDLEVVSAMGTGAGYLSVLVLALYIQDTHTAEMYHSPEFIWLACPLLLYWISRAWLIAHRGEMHDDPIIFALKDRASWIVGGCFITVFGLARYVV